jgi:hypothetical protein
MSFVRDRKNAAAAVRRLTFDPSRLTAAAISERDRSVGVAGDAAGFAAFRAFRLSALRRESSDLAAAAISVKDDWAMTERRFQHNRTAERADVSQSFGDRHAC